MDTCDHCGPKRATIEIKRSMILREPPAASKPGSVSEAKVVALLRPEIPGNGAILDSIDDAQDQVAKYRIMDGIGPCYEFRGKATCKNDLVEINLVGDLNKLR